MAAAMLMRVWSITTTNEKKAHVDLKTVSERQMRIGVDSSTQRDDGHGQRGGAHCSFTEANKPAPPAPPAFEVPP